MLGGLPSLAVLTLQTVLPFLVVWYLLVPLFFRLTKRENTKRQRFVVTLLFLLLTFGGLAIWNAHPTVTCPPEYQAAFTPEKRARGIHYARLSAGLFYPIQINVLEVRDYGGVSIEIKYLLLHGSMILDYDEIDGVPVVLAKPYY